MAGGASFFVYSSFPAGYVNHSRGKCGRLTGMCARLSDMWPELSDMCGDFKLNIPELCADSGFFSEG